MIISQLNLFTWIIYIYAYIYIYLYIYIYIYISIYIYIYIYIYILTEIYLVLIKMLIHLKLQTCFVLPGLSKICSTLYNLCQQSLTKQQRTYTICIYIYTYMYILYMYIINMHHIAGKFVGNTWNILRKNRLTTLFAFSSSWKVTRFSSSVHL